jgi:hypothetical protein
MNASQAGGRVSQEQRGNRNIAAGGNVNFFKSPKVVLAAIIIAAAVLGAVYYFKSPDSTADYQKRVLATCSQVNDVLNVEHNDALILDQPGEFRIRKASFLAYTRANIDTARQSFDLLNEEDVPGGLREQRETAKKAQEAWLERMEKDLQTYERDLRDGDPVSKVNAIGAASQPAHTQLNSAMTALAGENCQVVGKKAQAGT